MAKDYRGEFRFPSLLSHYLEQCLISSRSLINVVGFLFCFVLRINESSVVVLNLLSTFILKFYSHSLPRSRYDYYDLYFTNDEKQNFVMSIYLLNGRLRT